MNLLPFKIYATFLAALFLGVGGYFFIRLQSLRRDMIEEKYRKEQPRLTASEDIQKRFQTILRYKKSNDVSELKLAIIEGDILIEEILRMQGFQGETVAALLSEASLAGLGGIDGLWRFHRLRNILVHDSTFILSLRQGQEALGLLEGALSSEGVITGEGVAQKGEADEGGE